MDRDEKGLENEWGNSCLLFPKIQFKKFAPDMGVHWKPVEWCIQRGHIIREARKMHDLDNRGVNRKVSVIMEGHFSYSLFFPNKILLLKHRYHSSITTYEDIFERFWRKLREFQKDQWKFFRDFVQSSSDPDLHWVANSYNKEVMLEKAAVVVVYLLACLCVCLCVW